MRRLRFIGVTSVVAVFAVVTMASQGHAHTNTSCSGLTPGTWDKTFKVRAETGTWTILQHDEVNPAQKVRVDALMYKLAGQDPSIPGPTLDVTEGDQVCVEF